MIELRRSEERDLVVLMKWLHTAEEARVWGGPSITYPFVQETLQAQIGWSLNRSYSLVLNDEVVGFAQVAPRFENNHLCRILVNPALRGQGLGEKLVELVLAAKDSEERNFSLFVYDNNRVAIRLYRKLGFQSEPIPEGVTNLNGCLYMVKPSGIQ